jgi:hypothetical protein
MKFYEVITNVDTNEVNAQIDLPVYLCILWSLVTWK